MYIGLSSSAIQPCSGRPRVSCGRLGKVRNDTSGVFQLSEELPAGAGSVRQVIVQVLKYGFVCDGPGGCRKIAPAPESAAPVPLANFGKFALDPVGRTALHLTDGIGDGELWGHGHDHVHMVAGQNAMQDVDTVFLAYLATNGPNPEPQVASQNLVAVLRRPDDMVPVVIDAMCEAIILHDPVLSKNVPPGGGKGPFLEGQGHNTIRSR